jgi:peptidoglycan hydrolase CwlO-like protein
MNLTELKAQAYDILAQIEYLQKQLQETNAKIGEELQKMNKEGGE